jgi:hydrogenase nickel incorporation protein HypA/HybF
MHEMSIVQSLLEQVRSFMPEQAVLKDVHLEVGGLEHLDGDVMQTVFTALTEGSELGGAALRIVRIPVRIRCRACGHEYEPEDAAVLLCPECGVVQPEILQGTGVLLRSLEIEDRNE